MQIERPRLRPDFDWQERRGRDSDGDRFSHMALVHASGRVVARIHVPMGADEYMYQLDFFVPLKETCAEGESDLRFVDLPGAQRFAEKVLETYEPEPWNKKKADPVAESAVVLLVESQIVTQ